MKAEGKPDLELLLRLISLCYTVEQRGVDPFQVEVKEALDSIRQLLPRWRSFDELCLDAEAVNNLSKVIKLQGDWLKRRASIFIDPAMIETKLIRLSSQELASIFLKAWRPIIGLERLSPQRLKEAIRYWNTLPQRGERATLPSSSGQSLRMLSREELIQLNLLAGGDFEQALQGLWKKLQVKAGRRRRVSYWDFLYANSYEEFVANAYLTSFLVTYGYAELIVDPLKEEVTLIPYDKPEPVSKRRIPASVPISLGYEVWEQLRAERR